MSEQKQQYVALISVPIFAENEDEALHKAFEYAEALKHQQSSVIAGHVEVLAEDRLYGSGRGIDFRRAVSDLCEQLPGVIIPTPLRAYDALDNERPVC